MSTFLAEHPYAAVGCFLAACLTVERCAEHVAGALRGGRR